MLLLAKGLTGLIGLLHVYIAWLEIFAWETKGPEVFTTLDPALFEPTAAMAANQGLYNAFLAAGLFWALLVKDRVWSIRVAVFFLACVAVAGLFGALTVSAQILFVQTVPAVAALICLYVVQRGAVNHRTA